MAKTSAKSSSRRRASAKSPKKATARSTKSGSAAAAKSRSAADSADQDEVTIDRRRDERRDEADAAPAGAAQLERRKKVNRRRQIDPTTCERDYTDQEVEFMNALDDYKRKSGRMFPTCSEVLEVLRALGYVKLSANELGAMTTDVSSCASAKPMPSDWAMDAESCELATETMVELEPVC